MSAEENTQEDATEQELTYWQRKLTEFDENVFSTPWYSTGNGRKTAFLIGVLMQRTKYQCKENFGTVHPVKRMQAILKVQKNEGKLAAILRLCEAELLKVESSQKRKSKYFGKQVDGPLRGRIYEALREQGSDLSDADTVLSFYDGYQYFLGV
jgi:hypothetical protein